MNGQQRVVVGLTVAELSVCGHVAQMRVLGSMKSGYQHRQEYSRSRDLLWDNNWLGAIAECAFAKHLGVYWDFSIRNFSADDVAGIQVRATRRWKHPVLRIHERDTDNVTCVLGQLQWDGARPRIVFLGWYETSEAKRRYPLEMRRNIWAHFVPQEALRPMGELPRGRQRQTEYLPPDID